MTLQNVAKMMAKHILNNNNKKIDQFLKNQNYYCAYQLFLAEKEHLKALALVRFHNSTFFAIRLKHKKHTLISMKIT